MKYILGIDQSTQGTKAVVVADTGRIIGRADRSHRQIINEKGWVSHNLDEIYQNVLIAVKEVTAKTGINKNEISAVGISNQRETTAVWNGSGEALNLAVVWQCPRAKEVTDGFSDFAEVIRKKTGLPLSPYFPAAKMAWLLNNTEKLQDVHLGTMDTWLIYRLSNGRSFKTDYSNASRTQLFNIHTLTWDEELCDLFGIPLCYLPEICDSNSNFGMTDFDGWLDIPIPIHGVMGDSHAALYGQGCYEEGMAKATYGTGSSIMMNTGTRCIESCHGLATSLAWCIDGKAEYVLEGNINYTGAVITWLKEEAGLISSPAETEKCAIEANPLDETVMIPAFSGLSAPYWRNDVKAFLYGMSRTTGKNEIVRAALDSIAYQIEAVLASMSRDSGIKLKELRVDGGPTRNRYLMQRQSDISNVQISVPDVEELSVLGVIFMAGKELGFYRTEIIKDLLERNVFIPSIDLSEREQLVGRWQRVIRMVI